MKLQEKVLCIRRSNLPDSWVGKRSIIKTDETLFFDTCEKAGFIFMDRGFVEKDSSLKQIIPYIVLQTTNRKKTALYRRNGNEKRLHELWSVGIGGHINPVDNNGTASSFRKILLTGMTRELDEELIKRPINQTPRFMGTINEEETPVGNVHLGAVFTILTNTPEAFIPGEELSDFTWADTSFLPRLNLELWSTLALELIG